MTNFNERLRVTDRMQAWDTLTSSCGRYRMRLMPRECDLIAMDVAGAVTTLWNFPAASISGGQHWASLYFRRSAERWGWNFVMGDGSEYRWQMGSAHIESEVHLQDEGNLVLRVIDGLGNTTDGICWESKTGQLHGRLFGGYVPPGETIVRITSGRILRNAVASNVTILNLARPIFATDGEVGISIRTNESLQVQAVIGTQSPFVMMKMPVFPEDIVMTDEPRVVNTVTTVEPITNAQRCHVTIKPDFKTEVKTEH